ATPLATARAEMSSPAQTHRSVSPFVLLDAPPAAARAMPMGHLIHFRAFNLRAAHPMDRTQLLSLLPHQGPALWLDQVLEHDASSISGLSAWSYLQPFGADASPCLLFEAAAQLCGAHGALYGSEKSIDAALVGKLNALQLHHEPSERSGPLLISAT